LVRFIPSIYADQTYFSCIAIVVQRLIYGNAPPPAFEEEDDDLEQALALAEE